MSKPVLVEVEVGSPTELFHIYCKSGVRSHCTVEDRGCGNPEEPHL
jgi:hypothetical protein